MKTFRKTLLILSTFASSAALYGCGDGYEAVPYHGVPYVEDRTAGAGVEYVRAHMLPEKGPMIPAEIAPSQDTTIKDAAPLFNGKQLKK